MRGLRWLIILAAAALPSATPPAADEAPPPRATEAPPMESVLEAGQALWDAFAPDELKDEYTFPGMAEVELFLAALESDLDEGTVEQLAAHEPAARQALALLRHFEEGVPLADWLEPRLDLLVAAEALSVPPEPVRVPPRRPDAPPPPPPPPPPPRTQYTRAYWDKVVVSRTPPAAAQRLVPRLKAIFTEQGVPPEWVWLAEVESSMNPRARSPAGAGGLFQFMPATAERFGLKTAWPDERNDPDKSARAAATYLRFLHGRFQSWPLAVAAYNAGEGRVGRALAASGATNFEGVSRHLPTETRLYVPKVLATVAARESVDPVKLPPPAARAAGL